MKTTEKLFMSHELAKILKESGFNEPCLAKFMLLVKGDTIPRFITNYKEEELWFNHNGKDTSELNGNNGKDFLWSAPLFSQVTNWLMEKHQIFIDIQTDCTSYPKFAFEINQFYGNPKDLTEKEWRWNSPKPNDWFLYRTYNEALTEAIKFSLTLIQ